MQVDVSFDNVKVYDINRFDVVKGQKFSLLTDNENVNVDWFTNNDQVLSVDVKTDAKTANVSSDNFGKSKIRIYDGEILLKEIFINVVENVNPAVSLNISSETPVSK